MMDEARRILELLDKEINAVIVSAEDTKRQQEEISRDKVVLKSKLQDADVERNKLRQERETFEKEKSYLVRMARETEIKIGQLEREKKNIEAETQSLETKRKSIEEQDKALSTKIKLAEGCDEKLRDIAYRESLLEKEKAIDRERKEVLDIRENKLEERAKQLQRIAEI